jgi:hypothetical protein
MPAQDFRMEPGKPIRLRIVGPGGKPVAGATVRIGEWNGNRVLHNNTHPDVLPTGIPVTAGADGVWEWAWAPPGPVKLEVLATGHARRALTAEAGGPEQTVRLAANYRITGQVTDAVTGKPIPAFLLIPVNVFGKEALSAERMNAKPGKDGQLEFRPYRADIPQRLRVEAAGYRTQTGPPFQSGDDAPRVQDFALIPSPPVAGLVVDDAGRPVAGAAVVMATPSHEARRAGDRNNHEVTTDAAGRFAFPDPGEAWAVRAEADAGVAVVESVDKPIQLRPWATVRGAVREAGRPVPGANVYAFPVGADAPGRPRVRPTPSAETGPDGAFALSRLPPGRYEVQVRFIPRRGDERSWPRVSLEMKPGETRDLELVIPPK